MDAREVALVVACSPCVVVYKVWRAVTWPFRVIWRWGCGAPQYASPAPQTTSSSTTSAPVEVPVWDKIPSLNTDNPKVVLMGDSVLDNFYWLKNPTDYLRPVLENYLKADKDLSDYQCVNLAVDQMSTFDFVKRTSQNGWSHYEHARQRLFTDPQDKCYYTAKDHCMYSIDNLKRLKNVKCVVVSVGGNDVYLSAEIQTKLYKSMLPGKGHLAREVALAFGQRVATILHELKQAVPEAVIVPVIVYHPHHQFSIARLDSWWACKLQKWLLSGLVSPMSRQFLKLAQHYGMPVIDLSRTFDANDPTHYGTEQIGKANAYADWSGAEPSNVSQHFIAQLVMHVMKHAPSAKESVVVYGNTRGPVMNSVCEDRNVGSYPYWYNFGQRRFVHWLFYRMRSVRQTLAAPIPAAL